MVALSKERGKKTGGKEAGGLLGFWFFRFVPLLFSLWRFLRVQAGTAPSRASCEGIAGKMTKDMTWQQPLSSSVSMDGRVLIKSLS